MPAGQLGRRPPKNAPALRLSRILTGVVPAHPAAADYFGPVPQWILGANDRFGTCGPTATANSRLLTTTYLTDVPVTVTDEDIFDLYRRSGNPGFDPATGADDNGVDMQTMLEAVHSGGIAGTKCVAFAKVDASNLDEVRAAIAIFGGLLYGVDLDVAQQEQTDAGLWDYQRSAEWGGHAILAGRYSTPAAVSINGHPAPGATATVPTADRTGLITWAEVVDCTDGFEARQLEEAWVVIWPEHLGDRTFLEGVNQAALAAAYQELTGRPFPAPAPAPPVPPPPGPDPAPGPVPKPDPGPAPDPVDHADRQLARAAVEFLEYRHRHWPAYNRHMASALDRWLEAKGLLR